ncbi:MAG: LacI family DNA-binding transcriptional regulator [Spirochaetales bacterium]|jgi:LacI family transcriptional regulator|nr:LacI family DNA-binding transcriptional regulator [Spirochaetales bacterium]
MKKHSPVTIKEIAEAAGVSIAAVSLLLSGKRSFSTETNDKIHQTAKRLGYVRNNLARSLAAQTSSIIGVLVPDIRNPFFPSIMDGISHYLSEKGYEVFVASSEEDEETQKRVLASFLQYRLAGVIAIPTGHSLKIHTDFVDLTTRVPTVLLDRDLKNLECSKVLLDNKDAAFTLVSHLTGAGHTKIGIIAPPSHLSIGRERLAGCRAAMKAAGLSIDKEYIYHGNMFANSGAAAVDYFLDLPPNDKPSAILSCGDMMTIGCVDALTKREVHIPRDLSLVSFDDPDYFKFLAPSMTCFAQPTESFGREAARLLTDAIEEDVYVPATIRLKGEFKQRKSVTQI